MPPFRMTSMIAKVRISRLVQNGIVTRNSQIARCDGGRVAMNHAVGRPSAKATSVVKSESFTERQKIVRCASARETVPSKMSRSNRTWNQACALNSQITPE